MTVKRRADGGRAGPGVRRGHPGGGAARQARARRRGGGGAPRVGKEDAAKLYELHEKLLEAAEEMKKAIERLIAAVTPEIAPHSLSPTELVLKRLVSETRREEVFVSQATLLQKLAPLPDSLLPIFEPLGLAPPLAATALPEPPVPPLPSRVTNGSEEPIGPAG